MALARTTDCVGRGTMGGGGMADAATGPFRGAACSEDEGCAGSATCAAWAMIGVSAGLAMTCTDPVPLADCPGASVREDMLGCVQAGDACSHSPLRNLRTGFGIWMTFVKDSHQRRDDEDRGGG